MDAPGFRLTDLQDKAKETIMRRRSNFRQFAEYQEPGQSVFQKCSGVVSNTIQDLFWFDRQSFEKTESSPANKWVRHNKFPTDNEVGQPTTSLKLDLSD